MRRLIPQVFILSLAFSLSACGGGGGGGGSSDAGRLVFTGATDQAVVTAANAEELAIGAYFGEQSGSAISPTGFDPGPGEDSLFPIRQFPRVLRRTLRGLLPTPEAEPQTVSHSSANPLDTDYYQGTCGGYFTSNMTVNQNSGSFSDTLAFRDYCEGGMVLNGLAVLTGRFDPGSGSILGFTMAFHPLTADYDGKAFTLDGQLAFSQENLQFSETQTLNFLLRDDATGQVFRFENYFVGANFGSDYAEETVTGRFYHPDYGYVELSCEQPLRTFSGLEWPSTGSLRCGGRDGTHVRMLFLSETTIRLEADTNGDNSYEWATDLVHELPPDVEPTNHPPVANAGTDQNVFQGDLVHLYGGNSFDPDGDPLTFQWYYTSCPAGCPNLNNHTTATPSFLPLDVGSYVLELTVYDGQYSSASDSVTIYVAPAQPASPELLGEEWSYGRFGTDIGRTGLTVRDLDSDGRLEIVTAATPQGFGSNQYWYVLRSDGAGGFRQVHLSELSSVAIGGILAADLDGDGSGEILVGLQDGRVEVFAGDSFALSGSMQTPGAIAAMAVSDLDGNGHAEIITSDGQKIWIFDSAGNLLWSTTAYGGRSLAVGNVDADPALEIVSTQFGGHGYVIDAASHQLEWDFLDGFGVRVATGDVDGDGLDEIVGAASWQRVTLFDADLKSPSREIVTTHDIGTLLVTDLDGNGVAEILYGDAQWGAIHCYEGDGLTQRWMVDNPEHGSSGLAVGDVDDDGTVEVIWSAGGSSSGPDFLFVADPADGIEWQNAHLDGPLSAVATGDVDDDGQDEIVMVSYESNSGYEDGVISIFDAASHALEWQSTDLPEIRAWSGINGVRIADVDGDGETEFVIATSHLYAGLVQVYNGRTHALERQSAMYDSEPFTTLEVADVDGDGEVEIVAGTEVGTSGAVGAHVIVFNGATLTEEWKSVSLLDGWAMVSDIEVADVDDDGRPEILVASGQSRVYVIDGVTHQYDWLGELPARTIGVFDLDADGQAEILVGQTTGVIGIYTRGTFVEEGTVSGRSGSTIDALTLADLDGDGQPEWILASNGQLSVLENGSGGLLWRSKDLGANLGRYNHLPVRDIDGDGRMEILVGSDFALYQFD